MILLFFEALKVILECSNWFEDEVEDTDITHYYINYWVISIVQFSNKKKSLRERCLGHQLNGWKTSARLERESKK